MVLIGVMVDLASHGFGGLGMIPVTVSMHCTDVRWSKQKVEFQYSARNSFCKRWTVTTNETPRCLAIDKKRWTALLSQLLLLGLDLAYNVVDHRNAVQGWLSYRAP